MREYFKRLKHHPGILGAVAYNTLCGFAGLYGEVGFVLGIAFGSIVWIPVLITARTQPLPEEDMIDE